MALVYNETTGNFDDVQVLPPSDLPVINSFKRTSSQKLYVGDDVTVIWDVEYAERIYINGVKMSPSVQSHTFTIKTPGENTIKLEAVNKRGRETRTLYLNVYEKLLPKIVEFKVDSCAEVYVNEPVKLTWCVQNARDVKLVCRSLNTRILTTRGTTTLSLSSPGTYPLRLTATNDNGCVEKITYVFVANRSVSQPDTPTERIHSVKSKRTLSGAQWFLSVILYLGMTIISYFLEYQLISNWNQDGNILMILYIFAFLLTPVFWAWIIWYRKM